MLPPNLKPMQHHHHHHHHRCRHQLWEAIETLPISWVDQRRRWIGVRRMMMWRR
jgi:hypothetical protein